MQEQVATEQGITYQIGHINFTVMPVFKTEKGEMIFDILLKLMKADDVARA
jgi:hypothetical protein